jgi:hypothetical protein
MKTLAILIIGALAGIFLIFCGPFIFGALAAIAVVIGSVLAIMFEFALYVLAGAFGLYLVYGTGKFFWESKIFKHKTE